MARNETKAASRPKARYYREFLTPALHRRFVKAAGLLLAVCFVEGVFVRDKSSLFWLLFPLGRTGIFAFLLSISALLIFLLRLTHLHFGERLTKSPASTLARTLLAPAAFETLTFYLFSAWWFSEVYIWTTPADFHWVVDGRSYERPRVNEWPVYLRCHFLLLAVAETCYHLAYDKGRVKLPMPPANEQQRPAHEPGSLDLIRAIIPTLLGNSSAVALGATFLNPAVYTLFLRSHAWGWSVWLARIFWSVSRSTDPPATLPFHYTVLWRSFTAGAMLLFLWKLSNHAFEIFVSVAPVKRKRPLSDDSKDPNKSLLLGLNSKKELVKEFAFWELHYISTSDEARRKTIYSELDGEDGSTWSRILKASLSTVEDISARIAEFSGPTAPPKAEPGTEVVPLPRLSAPLQEGQVLRAPPKATTKTEAVEDAFGGFARSIGESPGSRPYETLWALVQDKLLSPEAKKALGLGKGPQGSKYLALGAFGASASAFFREPFSRRAKMVIFGSPRSDLRPILLSLDSVTNFTLHAVKEDPYGSVNKDIARILRSLVKVTTDTEKFIQEGDMEKLQGRDIDLLFRFLRGALKLVLEEYEEYASDIGLGPTEIRDARTAAGIR